MKADKQLSKTNLNELVETHNLVRSLNRLAGAPYDADRWRRALYHALGMSNVAGRELTKRVREALELP
jgi:hypothetical protein